MRLVSLCSGYGGLDLAVEQTFGAYTVAFSEIEPAPSAVFARHWPDARPLGDLTAVDWTTIEADIVAAGFPCQDLSYAGKGRGIVADSRSGLWYAIEHALGVLRPRWVVLENVAAIVARRPGLDVVLARLAALGFDAEWTCVRASDVGAPHRRERWFLVARRAPDAGHGTRGPQLGVEHDLSSTGAGQSGEVVAADADDDGREWGQERDLGAVRSGVEAPWRGDAQRLDPPIADTHRGDCGRSAGAREAHDPRSRQGVAAADPDLAGPQGSEPASRRDVPARSGPWGEYGAAVARWERVLGRPAPAPTDQRGRLNPAFVEWMQGLKDGWVTGTAGLSRAQQLRCLGNGVVPQQADYALGLLLARKRMEAAA